MLFKIIGAITFAALIQLPALANKLFVREGDTLSEIAERNNISLKQLMKINKIKDPNNIAVGQTIYTSTITSQLEPNNNREHYVKKGETLSSIARKYNVKEEDISDMNYIKDNNFLYFGQALIIPTSSTINKSRGKAKHHYVKPGETISEIAKLYRISENYIISLNRIKDPSLLAVGTKLYLRNDDSIKGQHQSKSYFDKKRASEHDNPLQINSSKWKAYGPLKIDLANWTSLNGSYVAPTIHKNGNGLWVGVNCTWRQINATGSKGNWLEWVNPEKDFEHAIINDRCSSKEI